MIGLDTNALLRLLTGDDAAQAALVRQRLAGFDAVPESVLLNHVVLVETLWTLRKLYDFKREDLQSLMAQLLSASTFGFENREVVVRALALFNASSADFSDCLIAEQNAALGCDATVTFDKAMAGLPRVELLRSNG